MGNPANGNAAAEWLGDDVIMPAVLNGSDERERWAKKSASGDDPDWWCGWNMLDDVIAPDPVFMKDNIFDWTKLNAGPPE